MALISFWNLYYILIIVDILDRWSAPSGVEKLPCSQSLYSATVDLLVITPAMVISDHLSLLGSMVSVSLTQTLAHILLNTTGFKADINIQSSLSGDRSHTFVDVLFQFRGKHPNMYTTDWYSPDVAWRTTCDLCHTWLRDWVLKWWNWSIEMHW